MSNEVQENRVNSEPKPRNARLHDEFHTSFVLRSHLYEYMENCKDFFEGNQWPEHVPDGMPRAVLNVIQYANSKKGSLVAGTELFLSIVSSDNSVDSELIEQFDKAQLIRMANKVFEYLAAVEGYKLGTAISYERWDKDDENVMGMMKGGIAQKLISPMSFAVANPAQPDVQKQKWVMFWSDVEIGAVKEMLAKERWGRDTLKRKEEALVREGFENFDDQNINKDIINHGLVRVYTRFYRFHGEEFFDCSTSDVQIFNTPHPLSTEAAGMVAKFRKEMDKKAKEEKKIGEDGLYVEDLPIDFEDVEIGDMPGEKNSASEHKKRKGKFSRHPFSVFRPHPIPNCFFGLAETHQMIPMQKIVNFLISMLAACAQNNAYGKLLVKEDALRNQKITNTPGQVLKDFSKFTNGWGITALPVPALPNDLINFVKVLLDFWSKYGGFGDILGGTITNQEVSGYAYEQAVQQANTITEQEQKIFWQFCVERMKNRLMYYKFYLGKEAMQFSVSLTQAEIRKQQDARNRMLSIFQADPNFPLRHDDGSDYSPEERQEAKALMRKPVRPYKTRNISVSDLGESEFDVVIEPQQGVVDSQMRTNQIWEQINTNPNYQQMDSDTRAIYIMGRSDIPRQMKKELLDLNELKRTGEIAQLKGMLQYASQVMEQKDMVIERLQAMLGYADNYTKNLTKEFNEKITTANKMNKALGDALAVARSGISEGEGKSNNSRGIKGSDITPPVSQ